MAILFQKKTKNLGISDPVKVKLWIKKVILSEKKVCGKIIFNFISDKELLLINRSYLDHDTLTDIITFDYSEGKVIQGEIFISTERVRENAKELDIPYQTELKRVMVHGILHLCGYKDKNARDKKTMRQKEDECLKKFR